MRHIALLGMLAVAGCSWMGSSNPPAPASTARAPMESGIDPSSHSVADITAVQSKLGVKADGVWGPQSERAMRAYQQANGLEVTGTVDRETRRQMGLDASHDADGNPYVHPDRPPTPPRP